jgi:hypothetical protein
MPESFSRHLIFEKKTLLAVIIPQAREDGMYYDPQQYASQHLKNGVVKRTKLFLFLLNQESKH